MPGGIGKEKTREDHGAVSDQMYAAYARGRRLESLVAVIGEEGLTPTDRLYLTSPHASSGKSSGRGGRRADERRTWTFVI